MLFYPISPKCSLVFAVIWPRFGKLQPLPSTLCFAVSGGFAAPPCHSSTVPPPDTCRKYLLMRNVGSQAGQEGIRSERLPERSPHRTSSFALLHVLSLPLCSATGKRDLLRDRTGGIHPVPSSSYPLISHHSVSGAEEPRIPIYLLEIAGFEFPGCFLRSPTGKHPKGLRSTE